MLRRCASGSRVSGPSKGCGSRRLPARDRRDGEPRAHARWPAGPRWRSSASNPLSTQDDTAAALVARRRGVRARTARTRHLRPPHRRRARDRAAAHDRRRRRPRHAAPQPADRSPDGFIGGTEETTTGLVRLRALEAEGKLELPGPGRQRGATERAFNDRYGTGQSALDGILRATNLLLAGRTVVVLGYGCAGRGVAIRARGAGALGDRLRGRPMRALEARMEGFEVMPALEAAARATSSSPSPATRDVLRREHFELMKDGAILANAATSTSRSTRAT